MFRTQKSRHYTVVAGIFAVYFAFLVFVTGQFWLTVMAISLVILVVGLCFFIIPPIFKVIENWIEAGEK